MADSTLHSLTAGGALVGTEEFYGIVSPFTAGTDRRWTANQIKSFAAAAAAAARTALAADTTYYVSTTGNDTTGTGAVGTPWATPQKAVDWIAQNIDFQGFSVTIQMANGTYTKANASNLVFNKAFLGGGKLKINGNASDRTAVKFQVTTADAYNIHVLTTSGLQWLEINHIQLLLTASNFYNNVSVETGYVRLTNCDVATVDGSHYLAVGPNTWVAIQGTYSILGGNFQAHIETLDGSYVYFGPDLVVVPSPLSCSKFVSAWTRSQIDYYMAAKSGTITGVKYTAGKMGLINTYLADADLHGSLPGFIGGVGAQFFNSQYTFGAQRLALCNAWNSPQDTILTSDAAAALAQRNGANAQTLRVYNTYTDAANYERAVFDWSTTPNTLTIGIQKAGTGLARNIRFDNTANHAAAWGTLTVNWTLSSATNTQIQTNGATALDIGTPGLVGYGHIEIQAATAVTGTRLGGSYYCPVHYGNRDGFDDSNPQGNIYLFPGKVFANNTINITGSHCHVRGGEAASASAGAANGGNVYLDGGQGYGAGTQGNIIAGSTRGALVVNQHLRRTVPVTKTADFTVANTDNYVICNKGSAGVITLPAASTCPGREISFTNIQAFAWTSASANVVPRVGGSAANAILAATDGAWCLLVSDGTNWINLQGTP